MSQFDDLKVFTPYQFEVEFLSPTHIGGAQEKNMMRGLDYILDERLDVPTLYILKSNLVMRNIPVSDRNDYNTWLATNNYQKIEQYIIQNRLNILKYLVRYEAIPLKLSNQEIRRQYTNGAGICAVPGSSIKGAIKSVLLNNLKTVFGQNARDEDMFGGIGDNLMQSLQVSDISVPMNQIKVYPVKVYSADKRPENGVGTWKDQRQGGHFSNFKPSGFVNYYECIKTNTKSNLQISLLQIEQDSNSMLKRRQQNMINSDWFNRQNLVSLIQKHTNSYIDRELEYYKKYQNDDLNKNKSVFERLHKIREANNQKNTCVLRVGANVGYHSITGDWQYKSHIEGWGFNSQSRAEQIKAKTRKFTFLHSNNNYVFQPMGFIKLTLQTP